MQSLVETNRWKWSALRKQVLARDGYRCQIRSSVCTEIATEVDHRTPRFAGGGDDLPNLRSVCHACHVTKGMTEAATPRPMRHAYGPRRSSEVVTRDYTRRDGDGR